MPRVQLKSQDLFQLLRPEQVNALSEVAERVQLKSGETVYNQGDEAEFMFVVLEGQVSLRTPSTTGASLLIDQVTEGAIFGYCVCFELTTYALTALCTEDTRLLKIRADALKKLMDQDLIMGYAIQTLISRVYFRRYLETMNKLQAIVHAVPLA